MQVHIVFFNRTENEFVDLENQINNFVALRLWRLGARDILELPLLVTSSKMETALMAGQT